MKEKHKVKKQKIFYFEFVYYFSLFYIKVKMNKFVIKKKISHNNNTTTNETTTVQNLKENVTYTKEQNQLYNHIHSIVANSGSIVLSDKVGKVE